MTIVGLIVLALLLWLLYVGIKAGNVLYIVVAVVLIILTFGGILVI